MVNPSLLGNRCTKQTVCLVTAQKGVATGPAALSFNPPPADFASGHTGTHPDGDLFYWIQNGIEDTLMPAFGEQFSPR